MCAHAVRVAVENIEGVEAAEVSLNEGYADITLAPDNTITVERIREVIRKNGFTPREAHVRARGTVVSHANSLAFDVSGSGESFRVTGSDATLAQLTALGGETVTVEGVITEPSERNTVPALQVTDVVRD